MSNSLLERIGRKNTHTPDVLACLSNLSSDEVFTPPDIVNKMLDMLPQELFQSTETKFLDPACKTGVFLREIAKRLIENQIPGYQDTSATIEEKHRLNIPLSDQEEQFLKDLQAVVDHVCHNQIYGIAITELTSLLSRRSLYCSKYPNSQYSISYFQNPEGNIRFKRIEHTWDKGRCIFCGAQKDGSAGLDRKTDFETYAYEFIHTLKPEEIYKMKFDVIISNPPYQMKDGGSGASAMPIYQKFVNNAKKLNPNYITMIIPARWYAGGKGLDDFRYDMLHDHHISHFVDYVNAKECFPSTSIGGGICYFLWDKQHDGVCHYTNIHDGKASESERFLSDYPVFVRYNEAITILEKVLSHKEKCFSQFIGSRNPFGFPTGARGRTKEEQCRLYSSAGFGYISKNEILSGIDILNKYKIIISKTTAEHANEPNKNGKFTILSTTKLLRPNEVCTDSYLVAYTADIEEKAVNCASYMHTKFFRFLTMLCVTSITFSRDKFLFVPVQDFSKSWTDEELYAKYKLSDEEIEFIDSLINEKPMVL